MARAPIPIEGIERPVAAGLTEFDIAITLADEQQGKLIFLADKERWLYWDIMAWKDYPATNENANFIARELIMRLVDSGLIRGERQVQKYTSARSVGAMVSLLKSEPRIRAQSSEFDKDKYLLNCPTAIFDAKNGTTIKHDPKYMMTKLAGATPKMSVTPLWDKFLMEMCSDDMERVKLLQTWMGYCMTGDASEKKFLFLYGPPNTGKSLFLSIIARMMGDYCMTANEELLTKTGGNRHPIELARLRGIRLVIANELAAGKRWDQDRLKLLTSGMDTITARGMREDFSEFVPQLKLIISGNSVPSAGMFDAAFEGRLIIVPCTNVVTKEQQDPDLLEKIWSQEADGIANWAAMGCSMWMKDGLPASKAAATATREYFQGEDNVGQWLEECCVIKEGVKTMSSVLFHSWQMFCKRNGIDYVMTSAKLGKNLSDRGLGLVPTKTEGLRGWRGIEVRENSEPMAAGNVVPFKQ
jgi:putative DNA primase/helicase